MDRTEIFERLTQVFRDVFDDESIVIGDGTTAADIEDWDSLTHITLLAEVEEQFHMKFSMRTVQNLKNVGELADLIGVSGR